MTRTTRTLITFGTSCTGRSKKKRERERGRQHQPQPWQTVVAIISLLYIVYNNKIKKLDVTACCTTQNQRHVWNIPQLRWPGLCKRYLFYGSKTQKCGTTMVGWMDPCITIRRLVILVIYHHVVVVVFVAMEHCRQAKSSVHTCTTVWACTVASGNRCCNRRNRSLSRFVRRQGARHKSASKAAAAAPSLSSPTRRRRLLRNKRAICTCWSSGRMAS